eukprot:2799825-Heterocapsa_arctica.AAC.1
MTATHASQPSGRLHGRPVLPDVQGCFPHVQVPLPVLARAYPAPLPDLKQHSRALDFTAGSCH